MTAEIAVLNRSAVALAADSAVTLGSVRGPSKIYESVNKLFALVKGQPVGIMVYGNADLMGMPWETIIKAFRLERQPQGHEHLEQYAEEFFAFVEAHHLLLPLALHDSYFEDILTRFTKCIRARIDRHVETFFKANPGVTLTAAQLDTLVDQALVDEEEALAGMSDAPWADEIDAPTLASGATPRVEQLLAKHLAGIPFTSNQKQQVQDMLVTQLRRVPTPHDGHAHTPSGLVIAGFGSREYMPGLREYHVHGALGSRLTLVAGKNEMITQDNPAVIVPFAQEEVVRAFMNGIHRTYETMLQGSRNALLDAYPSAAVDVVRAMVTIDDRQAAAIISQLSSLLGVEHRRVEDEIRDLKNRQSMPIVLSVAHLPKDELASMAESMVTLTSLRKRISVDQAQTVGGPVDVAVISRGDGFVWIKRKHYFDPELNPSWHLTHANR